ncbi:unnamed protein product [Mucor fragilis]
MLTAYLNNIRNNFGIQLRRAVNLLLDVKPRIASIRLAAMLERQRTGNVVDADARIREQVTGPATAFKLAICNTTSLEALRERFVPTDPLFRRVLFYLRPCFESYPEDYVFEQNNIYYDCKANPARHFKAYYCLAMVFDQLNARNINCFPARTTWIPSYVTIDTKIMLQNIIGERWPSRGSVPNRPIWRRALDLNRPVFKNQSRGPRLKFHNMIQTDGVGVSVLKSRRRPGQRQVAAPPADQPEFEYIHRLNQQDQALIQNNCIVVDPGRRDLLFFVHEDSDVTTPRRFRYTKQHQDKNEKRKKFRRIRNRIKTAEVREAEQRLVNSRSYNLAEFTQFIRERSAVHDILRTHYAGILTDSDNNQYSLHRKLKLSAKFNRDRTDTSFIRDLQGQFPEATYIIGNWSAPMARFREPIRGLGFHRLLKKHGFNVFLIDEYKTSKVCPECHEETAVTFKRVRNPQPRRRHQQRYNAFVTRHGILRCTNQNHPAHALPLGTVYRLWNRDLSACLNMIQILASVRAGQGIPPQFRQRQEAMI